MCPSSEPASKSNVLRRYMGAVQDARLAPMGNHAGLHPKERAAAAISISDLAAAESEEAMDQLLRRDVDSPAWETLHPKTHGAGPQSLKDSRPSVPTSSALRRISSRSASSWRVHCSQACRLAPSRSWIRNVAMGAAAEQDGASV